MWEQQAGACHKHPLPASSGSPDRVTGQHLLLTVKVWGLWTLLFTALTPWPSAPCPTPSTAHTAHSPKPVVEGGVRTRAGPPGSRHCSVAMEAGQAPAYPPHEEAWGGSHPGPLTHAPFRHHLCHNESGW